MGQHSRKGGRARRALLVTLATLTGASPFASVEPAGATPPPPPLPAGHRFVAVAAQSLILGPNTKVLSGNVGVNDTIRNVIEAEIGAGTTFGSGGSVWADTARFGTGVTLPQVIANQVHTPPASTQIFTPFTSPVSAFPAINSASPAYWNPVTASSNRTLAAGNYGDVRVEPGVTMSLSGGAYHFRTLTIDQGGVVRGLAPTEIRVAREVTVARRGRLEASDQVEARKMIVTSAAGTGAKFGPESVVRANVVMPVGALSFGGSAQGIGIFRGQSITTAANATLRLDGPVSKPPSGGVAKLVVDKTGPASAAQGANLSYNIVVTNTGDAAAQAVTLTDTLPTTGTFISSTPALTPSGGKLTLNVGTLAAKASKQLAVVWKAPTTGTSILNKATATATGLTAVNDQVTTSLTSTDPVPEKKLTVDVTALPQVQVGEDFDIEVLVKNGTDAVVKAASVVITLPAGHFLGAEPKTTPSAGKLTVAFGDLAAGATRKVIVRWRPTATGTLTTPATVSGTGAPSATDSATTQVVSKPVESLDYQHFAELRVTDADIEDRMKEWSCVTGGGAVTAPKFSDALAEARTFAKAQTDEASYNAMKADLVDPRDAARMAGIAVLLERPAAGLAVLLEAHDREPNNPDHLLNAAAFLLKLNKAFSALGFLAEAERVGGLTSIPLGISARSALLTTRAAALMSFGDNAGAEKAAREATTLAPKSSEAQLVLSNALKCLSRPAESVAPYKTAINPVPKPVVIDEDNGGISGIDSLYAYDIPSGQPTMRLPSVIDFHDVNQAETVHKRYFEEMSPQARARSQSRFDRHKQLRNQAIAAGWFTPMTEKTIELTRLRIAALTRSTPALKAKWDDVEAAEEEIDRQSDYYRDCGDGGPWCNKWGGGMENCRNAMADYLKVWRPLEMEHTQAVDAYLQAAYPYWQGIRSNFSDPISREMVQQMIDNEVDSLYYTFANGKVGSMANFIRMFHCTGTGGTIDPEDPESEREGPESTTLCNASTKKINFVVDLKVAKYTQNCEKGSLDVSLTKWKWLGAFAKAELGRNGMSFYLGVKAATPSGAKIGVFGGSASFESGLYLKFDRDLKFKDVGWRVGPKVSASTGPIQVEVFDDRMDLSFVGTVDYLIGG